MTLTVPTAVYNEMLAHVQAVYPQEGCGLLAGQRQQILAHYPITNVRQSPVAYEMDPRQQVQALWQMAQQQHTLLAIYHSHPAGPETPSESDVALATYPEAYYLIISLKTRHAPIMRAFSIRQGRIQAVKWRRV